VSVLEFSLQATDVQSCYEVFSDLLFSILLSACPVCPVSIVYSLFVRVVNCFVLFVL